jgi:TonB family protein
MEAIENIKLKFQCNEDWNKMKPCINGRHCQVCNKTVIDFTNKSAEDLKFIQETTKGSICGRFEPKQTIYNKPKWYNGISKIAASFLVILGLSNCKETTKEQPKLNTDKVNSVDSNDYKVLGKVCLPEIKDTNQIMGDISETDSLTPRDYSFYDEIPEYINNGEEGLMKFLKTNMKMIDTIEGRVVTNFIVDKNGNTKNIKITRSLSKGNDNEAIRVIKLLKFKPMKNETNFALPITFELEEK